VASECLAAPDDGFKLQDDAAILAELEWLLSLLDLPRPVIFRSNHASNCLPLAGTLPKDRDRLLARVARTPASPLCVRGPCAAFEVSRHGDTPGC
jgi:hypothetical protein